MKPIKNIETGNDKNLEERLRVFIERVFIGLKRTYDVSAKVDRDVLRIKVAQ